MYLNDCLSETLTCHCVTEVRNKKGVVRVGGSQSGSRRVYRSPSVCWGRACVLGTRRLIQCLLFWQIIILRSDDTWDPSDLRGWTIVLPGCIRRMKKSGVGFSCLWKMLNLLDMLDWPFQDTRVFLCIFTYQGSLGGQCDKMEKTKSLNS